ncbi:50S ribosomal protein L25/general stress protein Ctc [Clostridium sp. L74]|uniref:50S ribosomal protein L25/general stress protein Ctc n=1 Tax=Clostridium sp. L74 TaxID=1560217 RepID=UPI0006AB9240|nr:50S ribosomal protein L25/general stress protein Ctc [Clostridium sp. L74]KOR26070.1 50S ribosomal protein L25 [Clostridium sp. L74]
MEKLFVEKRICKNNNKIRKEGKVPGIIYGNNLNNLMFEVGEIELNSIISQIGEHGVADVNYEEKDYKVLIKEVQKDPVKKNVIHIDLENVTNSSNLINAEIPILFLGDELIIKKGGVVQKEKSSIKVRCPEEKLPNNVMIDLSKYDIGKTFRISDLELGEDITFMENLDSTIASIFFG